MTDTDFSARYQCHTQALCEANALNKTAVFDALATAGIATVTVHFNGESDSGQIEDVAAYAKEGDARIPETPITLHCANWGAPELTSSSCSLREAVEDLCYDYLSQEHDGWENNDGGYGEFTFHVEDRRIELDFNARFTDTVHHGHVF
jgi:uncharacterized protein DUF6878